MKEKIKQILNKEKIYEFAVCEFSYIENHLINCRAKNRLPQNAKSIIIMAFPYKVEDKKPLNISRYAAVPDYHDVCGKMINNAAEKLKEQFCGNSFVPFLDNSPVPEVSAAAHAGLGAMGKNGLLIHEKYGSYVFLGEIITDLEISPDKGDKKCLDCGQCINACKGVASKEHCLSAVNQKKSGLTQEQIAEIQKSGICWGCDECSEICPMNKTAEKTYIEEFIKGYRSFYSPNEDPTGRAYNWRGPEIILRNYKIINNSLN